MAGKRRNRVQANSAGEHCDSTHFLLDKFVIYDDNQFKRFSISIKQLAPACQQLTRTQISRSDTPRTIFQSATLRRQTSARARGGQNSSNIPAVSMFSQIGKSNQSRTNFQRFEHEKSRHGSITKTHAPSWQPKTIGARRYYILMSHIVGNNTSDNHIVNRVRIERAIANSLGCGLFFPYHKMTLKSKLKVDSLSMPADQLIKLLADHAEDVLTDSKVAIVIDDLQMLRRIEQNQLNQSTQKLLNAGIMITISHPVNSSMPLVTPIKSSDSLIESLQQIAA